MKSYYTKQLEKLNGFVQVKFVSENGETKWLDLNKECCQDIAKTLTELEAKKQITLSHTQGTF